MPSSGTSDRRVVDKRDVPAFVVRHLDRQAEALQFLHEHLERFRHARFEHVFTLHDRFVCLDAADDVVRLHREQFLEDVRGAVRFQCPNFHFAEALAAELRLTTQRLLRDEGVRARAAGVDLVLHKVDELEHVDVADRQWLVERLARSAVVEDHLAEQWRRDPRLDVHLLSLRFEVFDGERRTLEPGGHALFGRFREPDFEARALGRARRPRCEHRAAVVTLRPPARRSPSLESKPRSRGLHPVERTGFLRQPGAREGVIDRDVACAIEHGAHAPGIRAHSRPSRGAFPAPGRCSCGLARRSG